MCLFILSKQMNSLWDFEANIVFDCERFKVIVVLLMGR